jgi:hypothetical protein
MNAQWRRQSNLLHRIIEESKFPGCHKTIFLFSSGCDEEPQGKKVLSSHKSGKEHFERAILAKVAKNGA